MSQNVLLIICLLTNLYSAYLFIKSTRRIALVRTLPDVIWLQKFSIVKNALGENSVDEIKSIMGEDNYTAVVRKRNTIQINLDHLRMTPQQAIEIRLQITDTEVLASLHFAYYLMVISATISIIVFAIQTLT